MKSKKPISVKTTLASYFQVFCAAVKILKTRIKAFYDFFFIIIKNLWAEQIHILLHSLIQSVFLLFTWIYRLLSSCHFYEFRKKEKREKKTTKPKMTA